MNRSPRTTHSLTLALSLAALAPGAVVADHGIPPHIVEMSVLDGIFDAMTVSLWKPEEDRLVFFYGDRTNVIRQIEFREGRFTRLWKSYPLGGTVREVFIKDLDGDGTNELITYTSAGVISVWESSKEQTFKVRWESVKEDFKTIQAMTIGNTDKDKALELIICADNRIVVYDGVQFVLQKEGRDEISPFRMLLGNVDGDPEDEIITSDGNIINLVTLRIEWSTEPFGDPIYLYDFNRDGALEVIGEVAGAIRSWDVKNRREIW